MSWPEPRTEFIQGLLLFKMHIVQSHVPFRRYEVNTNLWVLPFLFHVSLFPAYGASYPALLFQNYNITITWSLFLDSRTKSKGCNAMCKEERRMDLHVTFQRYISWLKCQCFWETKKRCLVDMLRSGKTSNYQTKLPCFVRIWHRSHTYIAVDNRHRRLYKAFHLRFALLHSLPLFPGNWYFKKDDGSLYEFFIPRQPIKEASLRAGNGSCSHIFAAALILWRWRYRTESSIGRYSKWSCMM